MGSPGSPLGLFLKLDGPWLRVFIVTSGSLLVQTVKGKFFIVGDALDSGLFSRVLDGLGSELKGRHALKRYVMPRIYQLLIVPEVIELSSVF